MSITKASLIDLNGQELILDADADTSITADTDDQIDIKIAGSDSIRIKANEIENVSGDFTLDIVGNISLDADDSGQVRFKDGGTEYLSIYQSSNDAIIQSTIQDADIIFKGNDGGSTITAFRLDISEAGNAYFNQHAYFVDNGFLVFGAGEDVKINSDGTNGTIATPNGVLLLDSSSSIRLDADSGEIDLRDGGTDFGQFAKSSNDFRINHSIQDGSIVFRGNDGGSVIAAMTISMADAGKVTTNGDIAPGGNVIMPSGSGISFAATSDASTTGASMSNELLDDYEEGSWTPVIQGTTANGSMTGETAFGKYTKVGNLVTAFFYVGGTHNGNYTGQVLINGFPYAIGDSGQPSPNCYTASYNVDNNGESLFGSGNPGTTYFLMYMTGTGTGWGALNWGTSTTGASGTTIYFTGTYQYRV